MSSFIQRFRTDQKNGEVTSRGLISCVTSDTVLSVCPSSLQVKYREHVQKDLSSSQFSSLPQTLQTERAKEVTELQSQVTLS